jgi:carbon monoxide dehydrogenase subunit G
MELQIAKRYPVAATVDQAWAVLADPPRLAACMPGAQLTEVLDATRHKGQVKTRIGPASLAFTGEIEWQERDAAARRIRLHAKGADKGGSAAQMQLSAHLEADADSAEGAGCVLVGAATVSVSGKLAQFGQPPAAAGQRRAAGAVRAGLLGRRGGAAGRSAGRRSGSRGGPPNPLTPLPPRRTRMPHPRRARPTPPPCPRRRRCASSTCWPCSGRCSGPGGPGSSRSREHRARHPAHRAGLAAGRARRGAGHGGAHTGARRRGRRVR